MANQDEHQGPSKDQMTIDLGPKVKICQINIEGISQAKCQYLQRILKENQIDIVAVQETHTENERQLQSRGRIPGYDLIGATYHKTHGAAIYARSNIENVSLCNATINNSIHEITVKVGQTTVTNIYKPPSVMWPQLITQLFSHPAVYLGDFNSHHELWKYRETDPNGEMLVQWAEDNNLHLIFDPKDRNTFKSAAWKREYNPDLCFVSSDNNGRPLQTTRQVLNDFPHSQHRPILIEIGISIPLITSFPRPRWNFGKADWVSFSERLDKCVGWIPPTSDNYGRFTRAIIATAKKCMPRGYRKMYIPGWSRTSEELYQQYLESSDPEIADEILHSLDAARREKWMNTVEHLDFSKYSRQAWSLLRKLGGANCISRENIPITPNAVALHIVNTSRAPRDHGHAAEIKRELRTLKSNCAEETPYSRPFTVEEITAACKQIKAGKAPGIDGIHPEFILHSGKYTRKWLACFYTDILNKGKIPSALKQVKIIGILKPGKPNNKPESYRPISLLSVIYKLLERLNYNRISSRILESVPIEQAGFRPNRSCADQVLALTAFIEAGFQRQLKTSAVFIDLTAAYDTVWRHGVVCKFAREISCLKTVKLIEDVLSNRTFMVILGNSKSKIMKLNNGLPQGSVLAPLLFSLYIADMPETVSRRFGYADDWAIATQSKHLEVAETILTEDLNTLGQYFRKWRLQPSAAKTESSCFHLNNKLANKEIEVLFEEKLLKHNKNPKYLGVTLDRTLSYKKHLTNVAAKVNTRNNILQKLCGATWGSSATTLRSSALGLAYSAAEYCAPVWLNSAHTKLVDRQLNTTMRLISGTIKSTPVDWLHVLSHIPPPDLRRQDALLREYRKIVHDPELPANSDMNDLRINRLRSRHPPLREASLLHAEDFNITEAWRERWERNAPAESLMIPSITEKPPGFHLPRKTWCTLNRIRTSHGICKDSLFKWGKTQSPQCDCSADRQTVRHLVEECPLRSYDGVPTDFLFATESTIEYINNLDVRL